MNIFLTGFSGFVGKHVSQFLSQKYNVIHINLRNLDSKNYLLNNLSNGDFIINCAASLRPKTQNDEYINSDFPVLLMNEIKNRSLLIKLIHLSTLNTLNKELKDKYTLSKRRAEISLNDKSVIVIRLPLIVKLNKNKIIENYGQVSIFFKYLKIPIFFYPMIYPGNSFNPLDINKLSIFIEEIIQGKKNEKIYNLFGKNKISTWEIFNQIASTKGKKTFKINLQFLIKIIPKRIIFKNNFLYNILGNINFEETECKKVFL